jgi:UDP-N-acetylglucosamine acyltransferase
MIHKTAMVEDGAVLGADVTVGPFAYIEAGASIGDGCAVGPHAVIYRGVTTGAKCRIHAGAVLGDLPQDLGFTGGDSFVKIGDSCVIREGVTIHRGTKPGTTTEIGDGCFLMSNSHYAHNVKLGRNVIVVSNALLAGYVEAGDRAFISGNCVVHQFVRIGRVAMLGGASGVSQDVPPFCTVRPLSGNTLLGLNIVGMRRAGITPEERLQIKEAFHLFYRSGLVGSQAVEEMKKRFTSGPAAEFAAFVASSKRGVCALGVGGDSGDEE